MTQWAGGWICIQDVILIFPRRKADRNLTEKNKAVL